MNSPNIEPQDPDPDSLVGLLHALRGLIQDGRSRVLRAVDMVQVQTCWEIGRHIVEFEQQGAARAGYGKRLLPRLAQELTEEFGKGFDDRNLRNMRAFYVAFPIWNAVRTELSWTHYRNLLRVSRVEARKWYMDEAVTQNWSARALDRQIDTLYYERLVLERVQSLCGVTQVVFREELQGAKRRRAGARQGFATPQAPRKTTCPAGWAEIGRLAHQTPCMGTEPMRRGVGRPLIPIAAQRDPAETLNTFLSPEKSTVRAEADANLRPLLQTPREFVRDPVMLEFLGLPGTGKLLESTLEQALMDKLQGFLLELGKGFAFVARQQRISTESQDFYIDLVFYNYLLKCFVLVDLKSGKLTHQDVGQMDMYVRMYDDLKRGADDNPTVGIVLCDHKDASVVRYSVLNGNEQIFATKYRLILPSEEEFRAEIERERLEIEAFQRYGNYIDPEPEE